METPFATSRISSVNLLGLVAGSNSIEIDESWKYSDYTTGHLLVIILAICSTYIFQLIGFIICSILINLEYYHNYKLVIVLVPYIEFFYKLFTIFLVHFQFYSFYKDPINIMRIISKDLFYLNIVTTVISTSITISTATPLNRFAQMYKLNACIILFLVLVFVYVKLYRLNSLITPRSVWHILGFYVVYSISLPFVLMEILVTIIIVWSFSYDFTSSEEERSLIIITLFFAVAVVALYFTKDIFMSFGASMILIGTFIAQYSYACEIYTNYCSHTMLILSIIYAIALLAFTGVAIFLYPRAYKYKFISRIPRKA